MRRPEHSRSPIDAVLDDLLAEGRIPALSVCVRVDGVERYHRTVGVSRREPVRHARPDEAFDLASVTKALAGSTVFASLIAEGRLTVDTPVSRWWPEVDPRLTVGHLLEHSSGWPAWRPFYAGTQVAWGTAAARAAVFAAVRSTPLEVPPGTRHVYSDLGYLALTAIAEAETSQPFDALFYRRVQAVAEVADLRWGWPSAAATECCPVRGILIEGTVHDLNCASIGGVSAHAGLFGTARAVATLAERCLWATLGDTRGRGLPGGALAALWAHGGVGSHCHGWDTVTRGGYSAAGAWFPDDARGHLGYTGTSVWVVPSWRASIACLTNRVHPVDDKDAIRAARPRLHDAVARHLGHIPGA